MGPERRLYAGTAFAFFELEVPTMLRIGIILGSTRPNRNSEAVAKWVYRHASRREDARFEIIDLRDYKLPLLDEPMPPSRGHYAKPHTKRWALKVGSLDAFVFVTPEYNHGIPGALKNAIDFLYKEWNNKAAGFVAYGSSLGARSVEHMRLVLAELQVATVRNQVGLSIFTDFVKGSEFKPDPRHLQELDGMLEQLVAWGHAMQSLRLGSAEVSPRNEKPEKKKKPAAARAATSNRRSPPPARQLRH